MRVNVNYDVNNVAVLNESGESLEVLKSISRAEWEQQFGGKVNNYGVDNQSSPVEYLEDGTVISFKQNGSGDWEDWNGSDVYREVSRETEPDEDGDTEYEPTGLFYIA